MTRDKKQYRILVIEDNPGDFTIVEDFLSDYILKPEITQAHDFKEGRAVLTAAGNTFDVVLLDLTLPDKSGKDLIREMLEIAENCPVIVLTGYSDIDFGIASISLGISDYLLKDELNASGLYKSIVYAIERNKYICTIEDKNKKLHSIAFTQSHIVRAPLARMMGIVNIIKEQDYSSPEFHEWIQRFIDSGNELDAIIIEIAKNSRTLDL